MKKTVKNNHNTAGNRYMRMRVCVRAPFRKGILAKCGEWNGEYRDFEGILALVVNHITEPRLWDCYYELNKIIKEHAERVKSIFRNNRRSATKNAMDDWGEPDIEVAIDLAYNKLYLWGYRGSVEELCKLYIELGKWGWKLYLEPIDLVILAYQKCDNTTYS